MQAGDRRDEHTQPGGCGELPCGQHQGRQSATGLAGGPCRARPVAGGRGPTGQRPVPPDSGVLVPERCHHSLLGPACVLGCDGWTIRSPLDGIATGSLGSVVTCLWVASKVRMEGVRGGLDGAAARMAAAGPSPGAEVSLPNITQAAATTPDHRGRAVAPGPLFQIGDACPPAWWDGAAGHPNQPVEMAGRTAEEGSADVR